MKVGEDGLERAGQDLSIAGEKMGTGANRRRIEAGGEKGGKEDGERVEEPARA